MGEITLYRTFSLYEEKKEFNVLRGRVPNFSGSNSNSDIHLAFTIDEDTNTGMLFPNKGEGLVANSVTCMNDVQAEWDNKAWGLVNIKNDGSQKIDCTIHFSSEIPLSETVEVGDYISYTPSITSYNVLKTTTGYSSNQIINPSELNLWRVITVKDDGTIEMISEYASSVEIYFTGQTGYKNFIGVLNTIAKQYENGEYTEESRYTGYNGQTQYLTTLCASSSCVESAGGGDNSTETEMNLITRAIGNLKANIVGTTTESSYWVASRFYQIYDSRKYGYGRFVNLETYPSYEILYMESVENNRGHHVRPIVILKSGLKATGAGTSTNPWKLS